MWRSIVLKTDRKAIDAAFAYCLHERMYYYYKEKFYFDRIEVISSVR